MNNMCGEHVVFGRRLVQSLPRMAGHCHAEIWHVELLEGEAVPRAAVAAQIALNT